jgi:catechol 2,3-dioxygenase-like lactoylglutathione lyase family enzyme
MIESVQVESVSVPVSDQDEAKAFYVDILGFELLVDNTWRDGMRWSEVAPENSATSLMLVTWSACMLPSMYRIIVVATEDIQAIHEELVGKGIVFELPPTDTPRGRKRCSATPMAMPSYSGSIKNASRKCGTQRTVGHRCLRRRNRRVANARFRYAKAA